MLFKLLRPIEGEKIRKLNENMTKEAKKETEDKKIRLSVADAKK